MDLSWALRLQKEIDQFLVAFNPDSHEQILVLLFYHYYLRQYSQKIKDILTEQIKKVNEVVSSLIPQKVDECAIAFDFNVYIDPFFNLYRQWKNRTVPFVKVLDASVHLLIIDIGFAEACRLSSDGVLNNNGYCDRAELRYKFIKTDISSAMFDEFDFRYEEHYKEDFDSMINRLRERS